MLNKAKLLGQTLGFDKHLKMCKYLLLTSYFPWQTNYQIRSFWRSVCLVHETVGTFIRRKQIFKNPRRSKRGMDDELTGRIIPDPSSSKRGQIQLPNECLNDNRVLTGHLPTLSSSDLITYAFAFFLKRELCSWKSISTSELFHVHPRAMLVRRCFAHNKCTLALSELVVLQNDGYTFSQ